MNLPAVAFFLILSGTPSKDANQLPLLTLEQAQQLARDNNVDIQIARERLAKMVVLTRKAWSAMLPFISATGTRVRNDQVVKLDVIGGFEPIAQAFADEIGIPMPARLQAMFDSAQPVTIQQLYQTDFMITANWVLLSGPAITGIINAYDIDDHSELTYEQVEKTIVYGTSLAYFNLVNADQQVDIRRRALQLAREHLRLAEAKVAVGEATRVVALRSDVEVATAEQNLLQAEVGARIAHEGLANLIGYVHPDGSVTEFRVARPDKPLEVKEEGLLQLAYTNRLDLKRSQLQLEISERSELQTWLKFLPTLVGTGSYRWSEVSGFAGDQDFWQVGLALRWELFNGGMRIWELQERGHDANIAALSIEKTRENIAQQVHEAKLNLEAARANLKAANRRVELARESATLVKAQFEVGAATQLDVLDANRMLADAETGDALAHLAVDIARLSVEQVLTIPPAALASAP